MPISRSTRFFHVPNFRRTDDQLLTAASAASVLGTSKSGLYKAVEGHRDMRIPAPVRVGDGRLLRWWQKDLIFVVEFSRFRELGLDEANARQAAAEAVEPAAERPGQGSYARKCKSATAAVTEEGGAI